jgi:hypothetical protein
VFAAAPSTAGVSSLDYQTLLLSALESQATIKAYFG